MTGSVPCSRSEWAIILLSGSVLLRTLSSRLSILAAPLCPGWRGLNERAGAAPAAQSSCAEAASFDLPAEVLGACIAELQRALEMALVKAHDSHSAAVFAEGCLM